MANGLKRECGKSVTAHPRMRRSGVRLSPVGHWLRRSVEEVELDQRERAAGRAGVLKVQSRDEFMDALPKLRGRPHRFRRADAYEGVLA